MRNFCSHRFFVSQTVLMVCLYAVSAQAASVKVLDSFRSTAAFYTSVFSGSGSINLSVDAVDAVEGTTSLQVNYSLSVGGSAEVYRSYGTNTLDLSFQPLQLSLKVKGSGNASQAFKFMLYEDQNMNGNPFESGDEIYEFTDSDVLSGTTWQTVNMPYGSFTKFGGGSGTLDLNRIGAWRIVVTNNTASTVSSSFHVDGLSQETSYTAPASGQPALTGSFVQLWNTSGCACGQWTQQQWEDQFQAMKEVCMNTLIVQYGFYDHNAWYQPSALSYATYTNPTLNRMFAAAEAKGMQLYLGLYFDESWNGSDKGLASTYSALLNKHQEVSDELYALFGTSPAFAGWYIPQEINDLEWQQPAKKDLLANWLKDVSQYLKASSPDKRVMVAPFFGPNRPADDLQSWWTDVLSIAEDIDEVAPQDGVGTTSKIVDVDVPHYFQAIYNACQASGVAFGATVESFLQTDGYPINGNPFAAVPAAMSTLQGQLLEANVHASAIYQFEWGYMQPGLSIETQQLYDDYQTYAQGSCMPLSIQDDGSGKGRKVYPTVCQAGQRLSLEGYSTMKEALLIHLSTGVQFRLTVSKEASYLLLPQGLSSGLYALKLTGNDGASTVPLLITP